MKNIKVVVIVPQGQEYKLASCFSADRLESMKRKGLELEVEKLVNPSVGIDGMDKETIVLDARPESKIHLRMPKSCRTNLTQKEFGVLARTLRYQMLRLDYSDRIFMNDIRFLCEYVIHYCPDDSYDLVFSKYTFATVGAFQYVDEKSRVYLKEIVETDSDGSCRDDYDYSDKLGTAYYLLARDESDKEKKHKMMMRSLAHHELCSLNNRKFPDSYNVAEYALAMIEIGRMLNEDIQDEYSRKNAPYDKAIHIMKHHFIDIQWPEIQEMEPERKRSNIEFLNYEVGIVEQRLAQIAPPEFHNQIESYLNGLK